MHEVYTDVKVSYCNVLIHGNVLQSVTFLCVGTILAWI
jgi:hypothetical protein